MAVTVKRLAQETVAVMRATMAKEIEKGVRSGVVLHQGKTRVTSATFYMSDPARWIGDLSNANPDHSYALLMLSKRVNRVMKRQSLVGAVRL